MCLISLMLENYNSAQLAESQQNNKIFYPGGASESFMFVQWRLHSPVPTNITSYVLPPGVFICGSTAICVNRYLRKVKERKKGKRFMFVCSFRRRNFSLPPTASQLTVCWLVSKLEVQSMAERSRPLMNGFWWNLRWPRATLVSRCDMIQDEVQVSVEEKRNVNKLL